MFIFKKVDRRLKLTVLAHDGDKLKSGDAILEIEGNTRSILGAERLVFKFPAAAFWGCHVGSRYVEMVKGTNAKILDTRKNRPRIEGAAKVRGAGRGGYNHRLGLYDQILIKDNQVSAAGGITPAVEAARRRIRVNLSK